MKIGFVGTGAYGIALASAVYKNYKNITMWTESNTLFDTYIESGVIKGIIEGYQSPKEIRLTRSYEECVKDKDLIFISSTSPWVASICDEIKDYVSKDTVVCIATKGLDEKNCAFLSDVVYDILKNDNIAVLSGPTFAIDIINDSPVGLSLASKSEKALRVIKDAMESNKLKLRCTDDLIGVQICGSVKNIIAIASGMLDGLGLVESTRCLLITESLHEIKKLIDNLGGDKKTILSFAGVGDLLLTCTSVKSRNYSFGQFIGKEKDSEKIKNYLETHTVEGFNALKCVHKLAEDKQIEIPIINMIYKVIVDNEEPYSLVDFLITKM